MPTAHKTIIMLSNKNNSLNGLFLFMKKFQNAFHLWPHFKLFNTNQTNNNPEYVLFINLFVFHRYFNV